MMLAEEKEPCCSAWASSPAARSRFSAIMEVRVTIACGGRGEEQDVPPRALFGVATVLAASSCEASAIRHDEALMSTASATASHTGSGGVPCGTCGSSSGKR